MRPMTIAPDMGMSGDEAAAFGSALLTEMNPNHLFGFTAALAPDHCVAASLLHARGVLLEQRRRFDRTVLDTLLESIAAMPQHVGTIDPASLQTRSMVDAIAAQMRLPPVVLYRLVRRSAGELVLDESAAFPEVPAPVVLMARGLVLSIGPVRVLDPHMVRTLLPPTIAFSTPQEQIERDRWVRHYRRAARDT